MGCKGSTEKQDKKRPPSQSPKSDKNATKKTEDTNTTIGVPPLSRPSNAKEPVNEATQTESKDPDFGLGFDPKIRRHSGHLNSTHHSDLRTDISIYSSISTSPKKPRAKRVGHNATAVQNGVDRDMVKNGHHHHQIHNATQSNGMTSHHHGLHSATDSTGNTFTDGQHDDVDHFLHDEEEDDDLFDQDEIQSVNEGDTNLDHTMMDDLGQTVTIFHANIEPEVLAGLFAGGAELLAHKQGNKAGGRKSQGSRGSSPQSGWNGVNDSFATAMSSAMKSKRSREAVTADEGNDSHGDDEEDSSFETVSVASEREEDDLADTNGMQREDSLKSPHTLEMGGAKNQSSAKFRIIRKQKSTANFGTPNPHARVGSTISQGNFGDGDAARMKNQDIETSVEPSSAAGRIINRRLHQIGSFDLAQLRKGATYLSKNMNEKPTLHMYDPQKDPLLATDEYEKAARRRADQLSTCSDEIVSNHTTTSNGASPTQRNQFNSSSANLLSNGSTNQRDYGLGKSSCIGLDFSDVPSSWDLLKSIPDAVEKLNSGGVLFRYQVKRYKELTLSERIEMATFINLSQYADEDAENDQPILDFVNNTFTNPEEDLTEMLVICARLVLIVPNVTSKDLNVDVITSNDYQKLLAASDEVMEKTDRPRTFRKTKTVVKFIFSFRVQMSGSERADEDELAKHVHHHDATPTRLIILERTRKNPGRDSTLKSKACTLYYDIPPEGWICSAGPEDSRNKRLLQAPSGGGVLQSHTSIIIKSSVPSALMAVMDRIGASVGNDCLRATPQERVFLTKRKQEAWEVMLKGGDFPDHPKVPWKL